ncbi:hypothetical protein H8E77_24965 [bacterium]|nr:hypothetical protein [bacterium]
MRPDLLSNLYIVKDYLKQTDSSNDTTIELLMDLTLGEIEGYCNCYLKMQRFTEVYNWASVFPLRNIPVKNISSVIGGTTALVFDDDYQIDFQRHLFYPYQMGNANSAMNAMRIIYDAGYFDARIHQGNNKIDFEETDGVELTATVAVGQYSTPETDGTSYIKSPATLLTEAIKAALEVVGASTYTVSYDIFSSKCTIISDGSGGGGIFNLLWNSGTNVLSNIGKSLGYDIAADDSGALTYISDQNDDFAPADLRSVFISMIRLAWERYQTESLHIINERIPDGSSIAYNWALDKILPTFAKILDQKYKRYYIG